ncbi:MAG: glycosyltransferase family 2 protein [Phycisphaeraceae bacterium]|nr:glycosyltransferase family 2 protein [Phycisphaeraceae bacterium]
MRTLLAIPVYNEQRHVIRVLERVKAYAEDVLVIDDGSTDQTPCLLGQLAVDVIRHARNRGYGRSMIDAFRWAQCYRYDWVITMDCDEQHEPEALPRFHEAMAKDDADVISGSRYLRDCLCGDPPPEDRRKINQIITRMVNQRLNLSLTDGFCGYKAYRVSAIRKLDLTEPGYAFPLQFWVQAAAHDLRIVELPVRLIYNDPNRSFGGPLNDSTHRLAHYQQVFDAEMARFADRFAICGCAASACTTEADSDPSCR